MSLEWNKLSAALYFHRNPTQAALCHTLTAPQVPGFCASPQYDGERGAFGEEAGEGSSWGNHRSLRKQLVAAVTSATTTNQTKFWKKSFRAAKKTPSENRLVPTLSLGTFRQTECCALWVRLNEKTKWHLWPQHLWPRDTETEAFPCNSARRNPLSCNTFISSLQPHFKTANCPLKEEWEWKSDPNYYRVPSCILDASVALRYQYIN